MFKAMETYRLSLCYSTSSEDVITIGIKIGTSAIYVKDFMFGVKFVQDAIMKNNENPTSLQRTNLLQTLMTLIFVGLGKYEKVCGILWNMSIANPEDIKHLVSPRDLAWYATISGI